MFFNSRISSAEMRKITQSGTLIGGTDAPASEAEAEAGADEAVEASRRFPKSASCDRAGSMLRKRSLAISSVLLVVTVLSSDGTFGYRRKYSLHPCAKVRMSMARPVPSQAL